MLQSMEEKKIKWEDENKNNVKKMKETMKEELYVDEEKQKALWTAKRIILITML